MQSVTSKLKAGANGNGRQAWLALLLLFLGMSAAHAQTLCAFCVCYSTSVDCGNAGLVQLYPAPLGTTFLYVWTERGNGGFGAACMKNMKKGGEKKEKRKLPIS